MIKTDIYYDLVQVENHSELYELNPQKWISSSEGWPIQCVETEEIYPYGFTITNFSDESTFIELEPEEELPTILLLDISKETSAETLLLDLVEYLQNEEQHFRFVTASIDELVWWSPCEYSLVCYPIYGIPNNLTFNGPMVMIDYSKTGIDKMYKQITELIGDGQKHEFIINSHPTTFYNPKWEPKENVPNIVVIGALGGGPTEIQSICEDAPFNIYQITNGRTVVSIPEMINLVIRLDNANISFINYDGSIKDLDPSLTDEETISFIQNNIGTPCSFSINTQLA